MSSNMVPFGRYKGHPVEDMLADAEYMAWVEAQPWFRAKYIHLLNRRDAESASRTPVHNRLQTLFLDENYCRAFLDMMGLDGLAYTVSAKFELNGERDDWSGKTFCCDVEVIAIFDAAGISRSDLHSIVDKTQLVRSGRYVDEECRRVIDLVMARIEIKPSVADEYPAILRQMQRNVSHILFVGEYVGEGATEAQFVEIFNRAGMSVVFKRDVDRILAERLLAQLDQAGITLKLKPSGKVTVVQTANPAPDLLASARIHRDAIINLLKARENRQPRLCSRSRMTRYEWHPC